MLLQQRGTYILLAVDGDFPVFPRYTQLTQDEMGSKTFPLLGIFG